MSSDLRAGLAVLSIVTVAKLLLAARLDPLADEAYYWVWSLRPSLGYFDQPPLIAWVIGATGVLGHHAFTLRLAPILLGAVAPLALLPFAGDRGLWLLWWTALPAFAGLTFFATPDALLLPLWALTLAGALAGGPGWVLAGGAAGFGFLAKYSAAAALPLLIAAADPGERRTWWPWLGAALAVAIAAPNLAWNVTHDLVSFRFQVGEGLLSPRPPGWSGPLLVVVQQLAVVSPIAAVAGLVWLVRRPNGRTERLAWVTAAPILAFFALSAIGGPPEAHWPAPAWIGIGLGLSHAGDRLARAAWLGVSTGLILWVLIAAHAIIPFGSWTADPVVRLNEGRLLSDQVASWVLPLGAAPGERPAEILPILTERYQEAALLQWHLGTPARTHPDCGRPNQYDLWADPLPADAWMVRPTTSGPLVCVAATHRAEGPHALVAIDGEARSVGEWQLFSLTPCETRGGAGTPADPCGAPRARPGDPRDVGGVP